MKSITALTLLLLSAVLAGCGQSEDLQPITLTKFPKERIVLRPAESGEDRRLVKWSDDGSRKVREIVDYKDGSLAIITYGASGSIAEMKEFFSQAQGRRLRRYTIMSADGKTPQTDLAYTPDGILERTGRLLDDGSFEIVAFFDGRHFASHQFLERVGNVWLITSEEVRSQDNQLISLSKVDRQKALLITTRFDSQGREVSREAWGRDKQQVEADYFAADNTSVSKKVRQDRLFTEVTTFRADGTRSEIRQWRRPQNLTVEKFDLRGMFRFRQSWILEKTGSPEEKTAVLTSVEEIRQTPGVTRFYSFENGVLRHQVISYRENYKLVKTVVETYSKDGTLLREEVRDAMGTVVEINEFDSKGARQVQMPAEYLQYDHVAEPDLIGSRSKRGAERK